MRIRSVNEDGEEVDDIYEDEPEDDPWDDDYVSTVGSSDYREKPDGTILVDFTHYVVERSGEVTTGWEDATSKTNKVCRFGPEAGAPMSIGFRLLSKIYFKYPNRFVLLIRYKTDADQVDPMTVSIKRNGVVESSQEISLPSSGGDWGTTEPLLLDSLVGGGKPEKPSTKTTEESVIVFSHPGTLQGTLGIELDEFAMEPVEAGDDVDPDSDQWFANWYRVLKLKIRNEVIPKLDPDVISTALEAFKVELPIEQDSSKIMYKNHNISQAAKKAKFDAAKAASKAAQAATMEVCLPLLESLDEPLESLFEENHTLIIQCFVLADEGIALYCQKGGVEGKEKIRKLLADENIPLLKEIMICGVPEGGNLGETGVFDYLKAVELYEQILEARVENAEDYRALCRLAIAVATELSTPIVAYSDDTLPIDPIQRYKHYESAYLNGDLDSYFEYLTVWEMRMTINNDVPDSDLEWGRRALREHSPQYAARGPNQYSIFEISYQKPSWIYKPHDMKQMLAGGGLCGPRALFARFICKAFGNPTWGVKQPSHAAYNKWSEEAGWGIGFSSKPYEVSSWTGRNALDHRMETEFRQRFGDEVYTSKVSVLQFFGCLMGELNTNTRTVKYASTDPDAFWNSLAILQRRRYYPLGWLKKDREGEVQVPSKIEAMVNRVPTSEENLRILPDGGGFLLPAATTYLQDDGPKGKARFLNSYEGGRQVNLGGKNGEFLLSYAISPEIIWTERKKYSMSIKLATIKPVDLDDREKEFPFTVTVSSCYNRDGAMVDSTDEYLINVPYTESLFQMTVPVEVELGGGFELLTLYRDKMDQRIAMKEIILTPVDGTVGVLPTPEPIPEEIPLYPAMKDREAIKMDPSTGVIVAPACYKKPNQEDQGKAGGWRLFDSVYGSSIIHCYFPDKFSGFKCEIGAFIKANNTAKKYSMTMTIQTQYPKGAAEGPDQPILLQAAGGDVQEVEVTNTNGAYQETAPVTLEFDEDGKNGFWQLARNEGCKSGLMLRSYILTPVSD